MSKKGVSLPVNVLVVLAIAIVVLLGVIAFFSGSLTPTGEKVSAQNQLKTCCINYRQANCPKDVSFSCPGTDVAIGTLAYRVGLTDGSGGFTDPEHKAIKNFCNCP